MNIDLRKQELQDGQILVVYIMLRTFDSVELYSLVLFYMVLESYLYEHEETELKLNVEDVANYLGLSVEEYEEYVQKLIDWGWFVKDENGYITVNYEYIYKLNQEIVSEEKKELDRSVDKILRDNKEKGVKVLLDRYWEC